MKEREAEFACAEGEVIGGSIESVLSLAAESPSLDPPAESFKPLTASLPSM